MEAHDLRVGNYVVTNHSFLSMDADGASEKALVLHGQVEEVGLYRDCIIRVEHKDYSTIRTELKNLSGIPITPKILEVCGFVKEHGGIHAVYGIGSNPVTCDYELKIKGRGHATSEDIEEWYYGNGHHKFRCLHELQNLYFCLTGEELPRDHEKLQEALRK